MSFLDEDSGIPGICVKFGSTWKTCCRKLTLSTDVSKSLIFQIHAQSGSILNLKAATLIRRECGKITTLLKKMAFAVKLCLIAIQFTLYDKANEQSGMDCSAEFGLVHVA